MPATCSARSSATITDNNVVWAGHRLPRLLLLLCRTIGSSRQKLSLNLGLRWDIYRPYREQYDRFSYPRPESAESGGRVTVGALVYGGDKGPNACHCRTTINTHYRNFQPRVGVAYAVDSKTVLRTSFNLAYTHGSAGVGGNGATGPGRTGYNLPASYSSAITGAAGVLLGARRSLGVRASGYLTPGFGVRIHDDNSNRRAEPDLCRSGTLRPPPYYMNWAFGLQRELPGEHDARHDVLGERRPLPAAQRRHRDLDELDAAAIPRARRAPGGPGHARRTSPPRRRSCRGSRLPFGNYQGTIPDAFAVPAVQWHHLLLLRPRELDLPFLAGHTEPAVRARVYDQISYTSARKSTTCRAAGSWARRAALETPTTASLDKALGVIHRPHLFRASFVYMLPFGRGRFGGGNKVVRALAGNWSISGIITYSSSAPMSITSSGCLTPGVRSSCMASYNRSYTGPVRINGEYGDGNALGVGAVSYLEKQAFGFPPRTRSATCLERLPLASPLRALWNQDLSVRRTIGIRERWRILISADVFNVPNNVRFAPPGTSIDAANFGQVTTQANGPRKVQFNARVTF